MVTANAVSRTFVATPTGHVTHAADVDAETGSARTDCGLTLPVGWQVMDEPGTVATCKRCINTASTRLFGAA